MKVFKKTLAATAAIVFGIANICFENVQPLIDNVDIVSAQELATDIQNPFVPTEPETDILRGDITLDGKIDLQDVIPFYKWVWGGDEDFKDLITYPVADVNGDGMIAMSDLSLLSKQILNEIPDTIDVPNNSVLPDFAKGVMIGNVATLPGETFTLPLTVANVESSYGYVAVIECDNTLTISNISGCLFSNEYNSSKAAAIWVSKEAYSSDNMLDDVEIKVPGNAEPGEYHVNILVTQLDDNGQLVENPVGISGTITVEAKEPDPTEPATEPPTEPATEPVTELPTEPATTGPTTTIYTTAPVTEPTEPATDILRGDVTLDGKIDLHDVNLFNKLLLYGEQDIPLSADVDNDGRINAADCTLLLNQILNEIPDTVEVPNNSEISDDEKGLIIGNVTALQGETVTLPLTMVNVESSYGYVAVIECDKTFSISRINCYYKKYDYESLSTKKYNSSKAGVIWLTSLEARSSDNLLHNVVIEIPEYAEPGNYPVNILVTQLDDNGQLVETPVGISGTITVKSTGGMKYGDLECKKIDKDNDGTYDYIAVTGCDRSAETVEIPAEIDGLPVTFIDNYFAFGGCKSLTSINVSENNSNYSSIDGVLFNKDKTELISFPIGSEITDYIIPGSVTSIGECAFNSCSGLTSVEIPDSVTSIGERAFNSCSSLISVEIPDSVMSIGKYAFFSCSKLTNIKIPDSLTSIGEAAFSFTGLTSIEIPNSVTSIGVGSFAYCSGLTSITIPESVTSIGVFAFGDCENLTSITIENPECEIYDSDNTISNGIIRSYEKSLAQDYAEKYGYTFESMGEKPENVADMVKLMKHILNPETVVSRRLDFNSDGVSNVIDSVLLRRKLVNG